MAVAKCWIVLRVPAVQTSRMDLFRSTPFCRRSLQLIYGPQSCSRRTMATTGRAPRFAVWTSPVQRSKKGIDRSALPLPPGVTTLDPRRFTEAQYFDISQAKHGLNHIFRRMRSSQVPEPHMRQHGTQMVTGDIPFPPDTRGFLYYRSPPHQSPLAGGIRFRVAEQPDKAGFLAGHDLMMAHGLPWHIPIWELLERRRFASIAKILAADGFTPSLFKESCAALNVERDSVFITALGEPWAVDWSTEFSRIYFGRPFHTPTAALVRHPWYYRGSDLRKAPFTGRGLVSVIQTPDGQLGLRVEKVLHIQQHCLNTICVTPADGVVAALQTRLIHRSTKVSEEKMDLVEHHVLKPVSKLPWIAPDQSPFEIFDHGVEPPPTVVQSPVAEPPPHESLAAYHPPARNPISYSRNGSSGARYDSTPRPFRARSEIPPRAGDPYARVAHTAHDSQLEPPPHLARPADPYASSRTAVSQAAAVRDQPPSRAGDLYARSAPLDARPDSQPTSFPTHSSLPPSRPPESYARDRSSDAAYGSRRTPFRVQPVLPSATQPQDTRGEQSPRAGDASSQNDRSLPAYHARARGFFDTTPAGEADVRNSHRQGRDNSTYR
ncbi:hypothetical protein C8R47DRAFT_1150898 [Mycena vitilis]|nr:hypothetical protein C8R47DRAFT_1150898 [Mycena vitilis]